MYSWISAHEWITRNIDAGLEIAETKVGDAINEQYEANQYPISTPLADAEVEADYCPGAGGPGYGATSE